ncbi:MAG: sulfatase [Planctomycetota bacterium]
MLQNRIRRIAYRLLGVALLFTASVCPVAASEPDQPNVLFILVDDLGWYDVAYNGSTFYETPRLDLLAKEWMRFDYCYTPSPMCSPTRISILTGKNPARHGITQWLPGVDRAITREGEQPTVFCPRPKVQRFSDDEITLGEAFQDAGYETAFYGKWHMGKLKESGGPAQHGYESQAAVIETNGCAMFYPFRNHPEYFPQAKPGDNFTDLLTDAAIEFISKKRDRPFYLHLCHFAMHAPIKSKDELRSKFEVKSKRLPRLGEADRYVTDDYAHKPYRVRQDDAEYAGELANLDANIGRLVDQLKNTGLYDNTIVILTGDNGGRSCDFQGHPTSNRPLRAGKTFVFEGGLRTPLLIHWPGHTKSGQSSATPVSSMDFYPTLLEMSGLPLKPAQHVDGESLVDLMEGGVLERDTLYWHFPHYQGEGSYPASAIRKADWKLIQNHHHDDLLLFDLRSDPNETLNLAELRPGKARQLDADLISYLRNTGAYIPKARQ